MTPSRSASRGFQLPPPPTLFCLLLCLYGFVQLLQWPILALDTDLWYHLNSGRYLFEHGRLPSDSFFSFVTPPRPWTDYFWLFQVLVYVLHAWSGYYGLVVFRAVMYLLAMALMVGFLLKGYRGGGSLLSWPALLSYFLCPFLLQRFFLVRPHAFTYTFMLLALWILELKPSKARYLPLITLVWANVHGIAFPVVWLILGSYALERMVRHLRAPGLRLHDLAGFLAPVGLAMAAVFATPNGFKLLRVPFISTAHASQYIMELKPVTILDLVAFHVVPILTPSQQTIFNVLVAMIGLSVLTVISTRAFRLSHLLLFVGGVALLTKGNRFMIEFLILALPLLKANPPLRSRQLLRLIPQRVYLPLALGVLLLSMNFMVDMFGSRPAFPMSIRRLPEGTATFLNRLGVGGSVLNHPNNGGYLQWRLSSAYKIFMDMEVPFLFTDEDIYTSANVYSDPVVLRRMVEQHHPGFILVPREAKEFPDAIKQVADYAPIFADDTDVLYVSREQHPALAARHELRALDSFTLAEKGPRLVLGLDPKPTDAAATPEERVAMIREAARMLATFPDCGFMNQLVALVLNDEGAYDRALRHAERIIRVFPESPIGYLLKGDSLKGLRLFDRSIAAYRQGLDRMGPAEPKGETYRSIGLCYLEQGQYRKAYESLDRGIWMFGPDTDHRDLYRFARAARMAGKRKEAQVILRYAQQKTPPDDAEMTEKIWLEQREQERARGVLIR